MLFPDRHEFLGEALSPTVQHWVLQEGRSCMGSLVAFVGTLALCASLSGGGIPGQPTRAKDQRGSRELTGSWQVTSAQTSLILCVEPDRQALIVWIRPGSHSTLRTSWEPLPGGILAQGMPRLRLW